MVALHNIAVCYLMGKKVAFLVQSCLARLNCEIVLIIDHSVASSLCCDFVDHVSVSFLTIERSFPLLLFLRGGLYDSDALPNDQAPSAVSENSENGSHPNHLAELLA